MDLNRLQKRLMAAAKAQDPCPDVPYAFERRIMARIQATARPDAWSWWSATLWRAATPCLAIMLLISAWTGWHFASNRSQETTLNLGSELETTLYAGVDATDVIW